MLSVMTFSFWFLISIVLGTAIGSYVFCIGPQDILENKAQLHQPRDTRLSTYGAVDFNSDTNNENMSNIQEDLRGSEERIVHVEVHEE